MHCSRAQLRTRATTRGSINSEETKDEAQLDKMLEG